MPDPTAYTRNYGFSAYAASNPSRPLPGAQVDVELDGVAAVTSGLVDAVKDIRAADGTLKNGIVDLEALSQDVLAVMGIADLPGSALVGTTDVQTLTNKTLTGAVGDTPAEGDDSPKLATTAFVRRAADTLAADLAADLTGDIEAALDAATAQAGIATEAQAAAEIAAGRSEAAEAGAVVAAAAVGRYSSTAAGIAATTNGQFFYAPNGALVGWYENVAGVATLRGSLPSPANEVSIESGMAVSANAQGPWLLAMTDKHGFISRGVKKTMEIVGPAGSKIPPYIDGSLVVPTGYTLTVTPGPDIKTRDRHGFTTKLTSSVPPTPGEPEAETGPAGLDTLGRWAGKLLRIKRGETVSARVAFVGDSWTYRELWRERVAAELNAQYGDAGLGFVTLAWRDVQSAPTAYHMYPDGAQVTVAATGTWAASAYVNSLNCLSVVSSSVGAKFTVSGDSSPVLSNARLVYLPNTGAARYRWNGGTWRTADTSTGYILSMTTDMPASGAWTLEIEVVSGTVALIGATFESAAPGIIMDHLGVGNTGTKDWLPALASAAGQAQLAAMAPDLVVIQLGTNDIEMSGVTASVFGSNLAGMIDAVRSALGQKSGIAFIAPCQSRKTTGDQGRMSEWAASARAICVTKGVAYNTLQPAFGDPAGTPPFYIDAFENDTGDAQHPGENVGGPMMAVVILETIGA